MVADLAGWDCREMSDHGMKLGYRMLGLFCPDRQPYTGFLGSVRAKGVIKGASTPMGAPHIGCSIADKLRHEPPASISQSLITADHLPFQDA